MEPITLCGLVIVAFGLWVEFEPAVRRVVKTIRKNRFFTGVHAHSAVRNPVYVGRLPICLAKPSHY
jgi:hypothetical protein